MRHLVALALAAAGAGCTYLPAPLPVIPPQGKELGSGVTIGRVYAPATAVVTSPSTGEVTLRQRWDTQLTVPGFPAFLDPRLHMTHALTERLYLGWHLSWLTAGLAFSYVPVRPLVLTLGAQTDGPLAIAAAAMPGVGWETQASLLVQPILAGRLQLIAGAGLSIGDRRRSVEAYPPVGDLGLDQVFASEVRVLRRELRADLLAGVAVIVYTNARVLLAAQPYFLLGEPGAPRAECTSCVPDVTLVSYSTSWWGMALTLSGALWF